MEQGEEKLNLDLKEVYMEGKELSMLQVNIKLTHVPLRAGAGELLRE